MNKKNENQKFKFVKTADGSSGLFNDEVNDIYHSSFGAKSEAEEKFINPLNFKKNYHQKTDIKVLDVCFGIGYNTKALIKKIIDSNYNGRVEIDALEIDKSLVLLSPFVKDGYFESYPYISYNLISNLLEFIYSEKDKLIKLLFCKENKSYITPFYKQLIKKYKYLGYTSNVMAKKNSFLHNIYYQCISQRFKNTSKTFKNNKIQIKAYFDDARKTIKSLNTKYDIIFLDAFTPAKLPTLWSINFFMELHRISSDECLLVTYSNSAAIRHAMIDAGFYVGKIYDKHNRASGTIASKNKKLIETPLDNYDLGLLKTNAGVYYCDPTLSLSPNEILEEHNKRKKTLNLQSSSQYIKLHRKGINNEKI